MPGFRFGFIPSVIWSSLRPLSRQPPVAPAVVGWAAVDWAASAGRRASGQFWPPANRASALAHLGRLDEAGVALGEARALEPALTLAFARHALPYGTQDNFEILFEGLRKAGLE